MRMLPPHTHTPPPHAQFTGYVQGMSETFQKTPIMAQLETRELPTIWYTILASDEKSMSLASDENGQMRLASDENGQISFGNE